MRGQTFIVAACTAMLIVSCSGAGTTSGSSPPTDTTVTSTTAPTTTTTTGTKTVPVTKATTSTSATTTTHRVSFEPPDPFVSPEPTLTGGGSGCSPGSGPLPDGVWFGFLDGVAENTIDFDLACYLSCDPGTGYEIGNQRSKTRTLPVGTSAVVIFGSNDGQDWQDPYGTVLHYEEFGSNNVAWVYVNDAAVTHIVLPAADRRGCRYTEVDIGWTAQLPKAGRIAFNDFGLIASRSWDVEENVFYWRSDSWQSAAKLEGDPLHGMQGSVVAASANTVAIGAHVHRWTGSSWSTDVFDALPGTPYALATSGDRVLMSAMSGDDVIVYVLTWSGDSWSVDTIPVGASGDWNTFSGTIYGDTFAISDTGIDSSQPTGIVRIFSWDGTSWTETATLRDQWDTGNWGSSLDLDGDRLLVGAAGATPGPGSPGGMYLYSRSDNTWKPEVVGERGEGFGFSARIDGNTIVTAAAHSDDTATFWIFLQSGDGWRGTPFTINGQDPDPFNDWVYGIDIHGDEVAVSTNAAVWIGHLQTTQE